MMFITLVDSTFIENVFVLTYFDILIRNTVPFSSCSDVNESLGKCAVSLSVARKFFGILAWSNRLHSEVPKAKYLYR